MNQLVAQIKDYVASKYFNFYRLIFVSPGLTLYEAEHLLIGIVIRMCLFKHFTNKEIICIWYPAILDLEVVEKSDSAAKSAFEFCRGW